MTHPCTCGQRITKDTYEEIRQKNESEQVSIKERIDNLDRADREYYMTTARLVEIGSRSFDIFSRSKPMEKRAIINFVLSNVAIDDEKLRYEAKYPFNEVLKYAPHSTWLEKWSQFRTTDWTTELDYPEYTAKEVHHFLGA